MLFDIPNGQALPRSLNRSFSEIRNSRRDAAWTEQLELRASSFPICPRAYHIYRRLPVRNRPPAQEKFVSEAAAGMGTALHLSLQKWFAIQGNLYGNFVCVRCKKIRRHARGRQVCHQCGRDMIYHEYEVPSSKEMPFSGHIDGILHDNNEVYLIDFKGSSFKAMQALKMDNKPKESHYLQVNAYANAVNLNQAHFGNVGIIKSIIILYVDRGQAHRSWQPFKVPVNPRVYQETIARINIARQSLETLVIPRGLCVSPSDSYGQWCPWKTICFSSTIEALLSDTLQPKNSGRPRSSEQELLMLADYLENN